MEAVISRMKTIQSSVMQSNTSMIRFVAVSATIPNAEDVRAILILLACFFLVIIGNFY